MYKHHLSRYTASLALACLSVMLSGCPRPPKTRTLAVTPICTVLCEVSSTATIAWNGRVFVSDRMDPNAASGFTAFRPMSGPQGNPAILVNVTGIPDVYGISEAWLRKPGAPEVHRAQANPAMRTTGNPIEGTIPPKYETDPFGSQWRIATENASGLWRLEAIGTSNFGEPDSPDAGAETVPRFMPVGVANPQMFASAGLRTEDNADRSTWLIETTGGSVKVIQDLLNGDDRFVPNRLITSPAPPAPAVGPPVAPSPRVSGPGNPIRTGIVKCAMRQLNDDITTRELHMIGIDNGALYHSMANNFGTVTDGRLGTFSRFRTISPWGNVGQTLGGTFGTIVSAAIVAHPSAISVFFVAQSGGVYRLWHTVRFSSDGSWRPAKNVLALSGDAPDGALPDAFKVSAGICPAPQAAVWDQASTETLVALWRPNSLEVKVMRVTQTPLPGAADIYSHLQTIPSGQLAGQFVLRNVVVSARPFPDNVP